MTDTLCNGDCGGGQLEIAMPFTGALANANALWREKANARFTLQDMQIYGQLPDSVAYKRFGNLGGLNPDINPQPYFDPRERTLQAPVETCPDALIGPPSMKFGVSPFYYKPTDVKPRTQYAPIGDLMAEPIDLGVDNSPCVCACVYAYSMTAFLMTATNLVFLRQTLLNSGLITVTPELMRLNDSNSCGCKILGGREGGIYAGFAKFASQFTDTSIIQLMQPAVQAEALNQLFVNNLINNTKSLVIGQARMNYARAEGPRAELQPYPMVDCTRSTLSAGLPEYLPGTGVSVVATDSMFTTRALTDPKSAYSNRKVLSKMSGLPIGDNPYEIIIPESTKTVQTILNNSEDIIESACFTLSPQRFFLPFQL
jgi:hypothetical protein